MDFLMVAAMAMFASGLTMFSGFGLGMLLLPVFALFFPVDLAVAATAVVHGANNILKAALLGRLVDRGVAFRFGLPAIAAAFAGVLIGRRVLHKMTMKIVQRITGAMLILIALLLGAGWI